jgi:hypothetical protein
MVVEGDDVAAVQQQAETIAAPLQGRVTSAAQLGQRVQNIYVELPEENVAAFKSQFDAAQSLKNKLAFKEQSRVQDADKAAAALSAPTGALRDGGKVGEVVRQKQKAVTKVVEIQVVPPSGQ